MAGNEWYTPGEYLEAARAVMGGIDLDPASCAEANRSVRAARYYTQAENGLLHPWSGRVWCNPPYTQVRPGRSALKAWVEKLVVSYRLGHVSEAICLLPSDTSTRWFAWLWAFVVCFPPRRLRFDRPGTQRREQPPFGTCFVYLGPQEQRFAEVFGAYGQVVKALGERSRMVGLDLWVCEAKEGG
jgi:ParB family chromosome partitioning protein